MESTLAVQLFLALSLIIGFAQLAGAAARLIGQPRVFGELLAGVVLGPTLLNLMAWGVFHDPVLLKNTLQELAELGVLFLMFNVGLEVHLRELLSVGRVALWGGTSGALLTVALVVPLVMLFRYSFESALFVGLALAATSVTVSAQTLLELGVLRSREGLGLLATAVVDDVLAILLVSVGLAVLGPKTNASAGELVWILVRVVLYLGGALAVTWLVLPLLFNRIYRTSQIAPGTASFALIAALLFGWSADVLGGIAAITGAFIAGVGLAQTNDKVRAEIRSTVSHISYAFLVPVFFVNVGLQVDLRHIHLIVLPLALLLVLAAVIAKIAGCGAGSRIGGFDRGEALRLGVCMIARGEVSLIVASLGLADGLLDHRLFEPLFMVILLSTVLTPPLVRWVFGRPKGAGGAEGIGLPLSSERV